MAKRKNSEFWKLLVPTINGSKINVIEKLKKYSFPMMINLLFSFFVISGFTQKDITFLIPVLLMITLWNINYFLILPNARRSAYLLGGLDMLEMIKKDVRWKNVGDEKNKRRVKTRNK